MRILAMLVICLVFSSCGVVVKTDHGFMSPDVFYATDGKIEVRYYSGNCTVAKQVLESLADKANSGVLDWNNMADKEYQEIVLREECQRIKGK